MRDAAAYRAALDAGVNTDEFDAPPTSPEILMVYEAFWELSTERQIGMAVGEIPVSAIRRHTRDWPEDAAWMFEFCIREMDRFYLTKPDDAEEASADEARDAHRRAFR